MKLLVIVVGSAVEVKFECEYTLLVVWNKRWCCSPVGRFVSELSRSRLDRLC